MEKLVGLVGGNRMLVWDQAEVSGIGIGIGNFLVFGPGLAG